MSSNRPIDFTRYPIRTCQSLHCCDRCGESITLGQRYHDGGYGRRAHVTCAETSAPSASTGKVYILDNRTVVGNCALFWAPDGKGYTCDLDKAGLYDPGHSSRDTDIDIPADIAKACAVTHVRLDTLRAEMEKRGLKLRNGMG